MLSAINNYDEDLDITIATKSISGKFKGPFTLIGQTRGKVFWHGEIELKDASTRLKIPKSTFPTGILQLTLFDRNSRPLLERLIFINHQDFMNVKISSDKKTYGKREKTKITLKVTDPEGNPVSAHLSATVMDQQQLPDVRTENIVSYFLLSSDLHDPVHFPIQYFRDKEPDTQLALDLIMMTKGWRRFKWEDVLDKKYPPITFSVQQGFDISGSLSQPWNDKPVEDRLISLLTYDSIPQFLSASTDAFGRFYFHDLNFSDTVNIVFKTAGKRGKNQDFKLTLDTLKLPEVKERFDDPSSHEIALDYITNSQLRKSIQLAYIRDTSTIILDEIVIEAYRSDPSWYRDGGRFYGIPDYSLQPDEYDVRSYINITDYLVANVPGLTIVGFGAEATIAPIKGLGVSIYNDPRPPTILLDGLPFVATMINTIPLQMVEYIDLAKNSLGVYGVVNIHMKKGLQYETKTNGIEFLQYVGYSSPREYYSVDYSIPKDHHVMTDLRDNLMWVPDLQTDSTGVASFSYFNSDLKTTIKVIVEGIAEYGKPGVGELYYEIE